MNVIDVSAPAKVKVIPGIIKKHRGQMSRW